MSMLAVLAFAAALSGPADTPNNRPLQAAPAPQAGDPVRLEDIQVTGRPLNDLIDGFIDEVAQPVRHRGLARWDGVVCVGAANLRQDAAQYLIDRVSTVAEDVGLRVGRPGCTANVLIVAAADADAVTQRLTERQRAFRLGGSGMDQGTTAFAAFQTSDAPVRWWTVSSPVEAATGRIATRIPGECMAPCRTPFDMVPVVAVSKASRLSTDIVDRILRTIVILDVDQVAQLSAQQLADYVAMVLAQIDPEADTRSYASVLNVFDQPESASGLTQWDIAYLEGLYNAERILQNPRAGNSEIARSIRRAHDRLNAAED